MFAGNNYISSFFKVLNRILNKNFFQIMGGIFKMSVNIFGRSIQFCLLGNSLGRSRDTAGDTENFILVVLSQCFLKVYKSGKTNRAAETYDRRFADTKFQGNFGRCHKTGIGCVVQNVFSNNLLRFGHVC